jgi:type VI secretion system protein ImpG
MSAHMQMRFDDAFPHLTQPLLETVYPNYVDRMPAIAVARVCRGSVA